MRTARNQVGYGQGEHSIGEAEDGLVTPKQLLVDLKAVFGDSRYKAPVLPAAAHEVMALSKRSNVSFEDVRSVVEKDATIAGKVLQVAQSPIYATRVKAKTLRDAVQRLGLNNIRDIVWQVALDMRVFRAEGYEPIMTTLQRHSVACAHVARITCGYTSVAGEYAFLCGLLHDVGLSGMLIALAEKHNRKPPPVHLLWEPLREAHAEASGFLVKRWKLDQDLQLIVSNHHERGLAKLPHPLIAVLSVAERLAVEAGYAVTIAESDEPLERVSEEQFDQALQTLGLNDAMLASVRKEAETALERIG